MRAGFAFSSGQLRRLRRLAAVACPTDAGSDELWPGIAASAERTVAACPPATRAALLATLPLVADERRWAAWWRSSAALRRRAARGWKLVLALAYYEHPTVRARLGYDPASWVAERAAFRARRWAEEIARHDELVLEPAPLTTPASRAAPAAAPRAAPSARRRAAATLDADVVVVGSGAGGSVVAAELAESGLDVLILEEGGLHRTEEFVPEPGPMIAALYRDGGTSAALGSPPVFFQEGRCVGGSTVINGAMTFRTPDAVLERWHRDHGVDEILPERMEPYFERVERFVSASRQDPDSLGRDQTLFHAGARAKGWRIIDDTRGQVHCAGCNVCTFGCPTGAKRSALVTYVPRATAFGARLEPDARVDAVELLGHRAAGVRGRMTRDGRRVPFRVRANAVFVCGGATQTPSLLARSRVRSRSGAIGRNLSLHPNAMVAGLFDEPVEGWKGVHQAYQVREFFDRGILMAAVNLPPGLVAGTLRTFGPEMDRVMAEYPNMLTAGVLVEDTSRGRVHATPGGQALTTYRLNDRDASTLVDAVRLLGELLFEAGARRLLLPFDGAPLVVDRAGFDSAFERPIEKRRLELYTVHVMGTAAMGGDPRRHVCDPWGAVYDADGLYVSDASLFPTPIGLNPMETIMALATRNARHFLEAAR